VIFLRWLPRGGRHAREDRSTIAIFLRIRPHMAAPQEDPLLVSPAQILAQQG
jgi:hypothetical protein